MAPDPKQHDVFRRIAAKAAHFVGTSKAFVAAFALIIGWAVSGPIFGFSDTWQLVINTSTTIITFLMVFLIQNTQNRDTAALHLKMDEVIHALRNARNTIMWADQMSEEQLEKLRDELLATAEREHKHRKGNLALPHDELKPHAGGDEASDVGDRPRR